MRQTYAPNVVKPKMVPKHGSNKVYFENFSLSFKNSGHVGGPCCKFHFIITTLDTRPTWIVSALRICGPVSKENAEHQMQPHDQNHTDYSQTLSHKSHFSGVQPDFISSCLSHS